MSDQFSIDKDREALALVVALAVIVIDDGDVMAMIEHIVKTEVVPGVFGNERVYDEDIIGRRANADETVDDKVAEGGVVVVA